jgi:fido (protein-threonine AMPylation protein)
MARRRRHTDTPRRGSDQAYLADLLRDFSTGAHTLEEANALLAQRSEDLMSFTEEAAQALDAALTASPSAYREIYLTLVRGTHAYLFGGILTNAGQFRQSGEPGGSEVHFGGMDRTQRRPKFSGWAPHLIEAGLLEAAKRLLDYRTNAEAAPEKRERRQRYASDAACLFYKDLSGIHPFYDGNGRVGRSVVNLHMMIHDRLVDWGRIDRAHGKFMRLINDCLKRHASPGNPLPAHKKKELAEYEGYLCNWFWKRTRAIEKGAREDQAF